MVRRPVPCRPVVRRREYGKTAANAVLGAIYAQAEDDCDRVEPNYINSMGRLAEAEGESRVYQDLPMNLFIESRRRTQIPIRWF